MINQTRLDWRRAICYRQEPVIFCCTYIKQKLINSIACLQLQSCCVFLLLAILYMHTLNCQLLFVTSRGRLTFIWY